MAPEGMGLSMTPEGAGPAVDVRRRSTRPLPEIPLPNDFATRFDALSPTKRRHQRLDRGGADGAGSSRTRAGTRRASTGWGTLAPISVDVLRAARRA
jgi:hypothetical protein